MTDAQDRAVDAIVDTAAEWVVLLQSPGATQMDEAAFMEWLRKSPLHVQEYLRAETAFLALEDAARNDNSDVRALLAKASSSNVVELDTAARSREPSSMQSQDRIEVSRPPKSGATPISDPKALATRTRRSVLRWSAAAAVILGLGAVFGPAVMDRIQTRVAATGVGEQRRIVLPDGSVVDLNTQSEVRIRFSKTGRNIELASGEAYFTVAHDSARPFVVSSGGVAVRAVGTRFNVYRQEARTTVTVLEGTVLLTAGTEERSSAFVGDPRTNIARAQGERLEAGSRAEVVAHRVRRRVVAIPEQDIAWREHRLIFEDRTIADVVAEFNRYSTRKIFVADAQLAGERIDGVFDSDKPQNLLDFIARSTGARIEEQGDRIIVTRTHSSR